MPLSNASRLADFGTGIGTAGAIIQVDNANQRLGVGTTAPTATLGVAGIVSATAFYGDGSNLDGVASAGLGTALSEEEFNPLTVIYQTSDTLSVGATITVDPPDATTKVAYTQYAEVKLEGDADLIVADGDDFIPDILGLSTEGAGGGAAYGNNVFNTVYADNIEKVDGRGAPNFPKGINVSYTGVSTFTGNVSIGGTLTYEDVTNVDSIGVVTARTGIDVTAGGIDVTAGGVKVTAGGIDAVGIITASTGFNAASNLILNTGGSERLRIGSAGQIGLAGANYGTDGQVLTSKGNAAAPQWVDASGGAWNLLSTTTVTSSTEVEIAIPQDGAYDEYIIKIVNLAVTDGTEFRFRMKAKIDGSYPAGTPYQNGQYGKYISATGAPNGGGSQTGSIVEEIMNIAVTGMSATFIVRQPTNNLFDKSIYMPQLYTEATPGSGAGMAWMGTGAVNINDTKTNDLTSIVVFNTGGGGSGTVTWNTGKVKIYGIS